MLLFGSVTRGGLSEFVAMGTARASSIDIVVLVGYRAGDMKMSFVA